MTTNRSESGLTRRTFLKAAGIATAGVVAGDLLALAGAQGDGALATALAPLAPRTALAAGFSDVDPGAWYSTEGWIDEVQSSGLMTGYKGTTNFGPDDPVTRGQMVTILFRATYPDSTSTTDPAAYGHTTNFYDVPAGEFYTSAVEWARVNGIVTGYGDTGNFGPLDNITREQIAAIAYRYADKILHEDMSVPYEYAKNAPDWGEVSSWAQEAMVWCYYKGILTGDAGTGNLMPTKDAMRAQIAKIATILTKYIPNYHDTHIHGYLQIMATKGIQNKLGITGEMGNSTYAILWLDKPENLYALRGDGSGFVVKRSDRMMVAGPDKQADYVGYDGSNVYVRYGELATYTDVTAALAPAIPGTVLDVAVG